MHRDRLCQQPDRAQDQPQAQPGPDLPGNSLEHVAGPDIVQGAGDGGRRLVAGAASTAWPSPDGEGPSRTGELARRLDVSSSYAGVYRDRLLGHGLIEPAGHGLLRYTIPYLGVYLTESGAIDPQT